MDAPGRDPDSDLCLACGLCCNSGLFTYVGITSEDRAALTASGATAPERIDMPCPFWDRCCTVYSARPHACREYRCQLLAQFDAGEVAFDEALGRVRTAIELRALFVDVLPDTRKLNDLAKRWRDQDPAQRDPRHTQAMLDYVAFRLFVERHFLRPHQHWALSPPAEPEAPLS